MKTIDRRDFLKKSSFFLTVGLFSNPFKVSSEELLAATKSQKLEIEYRTLGKTGLRATTVGYGAMRTTDSAVLQKALDQGINFVDTAHGYQDGNNEVMVGKVLQSRRKEVILCTKIRQKSASEMTRMFETSLARLRTDYVDVLYLHNLKSVSDVQNSEALKLFSDLKQAGKIRFMGFSTHQNEAELVRQAALDKTWDVVLVAYNFEKEAALTEAIQKAATAGIGMVAMKTQAGGYKTETMGKLSPHQAALKWVLKNPNVHTTIPSMTTFAELEEDIQVMSQKMSWRDEKILELYSQSIDKLYCRSCGVCLATCPYGVDIPEINRCLMYFSGYGDPELAVVNYQELTPAQNALKCQACHACVAQCKHGIDLARRLPRTHRLLA